MNEFVGSFVFWKKLGTIIEQHIPFANFSQVAFKNVGMFFEVLMNFIRIRFVVSTAK
ncbi:hypothetical protein LEP1GSC188_1825 [Leptospira weilii serovar Topaz str. LT2116]|uniref:Uncharacterized protein n=1 Tax=Leptospira weilii serovar Topaz str. LT2116 TaxID=1088540 RepID=M3G1L1_9LEPT|nr:hypothetical protein LEP1GSC188_1825 [Leptospira weilii serovar Topaz str. LT2116]